MLELDYGVVSCLTPSQKPAQTKPPQQPSEYLTAAKYYYDASARYLQQ